MEEYFIIKDNFIYATKDLLIDSKESVFESNISFAPLCLETCQEFNSKGDLLRETSEHGIIVLRYLQDKQPIMFRNNYINERVNNFRFKFCCEEGKECYLKKDIPIIQIIDNIDNLFTDNEVDFSNLNPFFTVEDNGFGKNIMVKTQIKLKPKQAYKIKSGISIHSKNKYLFLARYFWKYGLVIQPSFEVTEDNNIIFKLYNAENEEIVLGKDEKYSTLYSVFKLKE